MEDEDHHEGLLTDVGFMFDACIEKVTCRFEYGAKISILLSYVQQEPGAMQVRAPLHLYPRLSAWGLICLSRLSLRVPCSPATTCGRPRPRSASTWSRTRTPSPTAAS